MERRKRRSRANAEALGLEVAIGADAAPVHAGASPEAVLPMSAQPAVHEAGELLFNQARELENAGDLDAATEVYRQLLLEDPAHVRARNNLGCLYEKNGRHVQALEQFEAARSHAPDNIDIIVNIADSLCSLSRFDQAERELRRAQKLDASRADVYLHLGIVYFKRGLYAQADAELRKATDLAPNSALAYLYRGESLNQIGRVDEALEMASRALTLDPSNSRSYYLMGILYDRKRMPQQAMDMYRRSREVAAS